MNSNIQHSSDVDIYLMIDKDRVEVDACLGNKLFLTVVKDYPPSQAEFTIVVDGSFDSKKVFLPHGLSKNRNNVEYELL